MLSSSTASKLDRLLGLNRAKLLVRRLISMQSGVQAVLFYGAAGSGKSILAEALAEAWLCRNLSEEGADGTCQACGAFSRGQNPDLLNIEPGGLSSIISVYAIVNEKPKEEHPAIPLRTFFRTGPLMSQNKVAVLYDAHRLSRDAANSLLKTLEEPELRAKLILTTDSIGAMIPTILSRCLVVSCEMPLLSELSGLGKEFSEDLVRFSEGAPGRLLEFDKKPEPYMRLARFAKSLPTRPAREALAATEEFKAICESLNIKNVRVANTEGLALLATYVARDPAADPRWTQRIAETHRRIRGNANPTIAFDALFTGILTA